jgi:GH35 family endo-1,4-beta-xylanase
MTDSSRVEVVTHYLKEFRRLSPNLKLVINDYDTAPSYHQLLKTLIEAGAPVDIIGQQCHMHDGPWSVTKTWEVLNRLSQLKRPILMSELSVLSGPKRQIDWYNNVPGWNTDPENEQKQADFLEQWYRLVYSHSNTVGIVVWNYTDRGAWLGAPVGFLRKDGTPKPAFERLHALINERWRTNGEFTTDEQGRVMVPQAYEGWYEAKCGLLTVRKKHSAAAPLKCVLNLP